MRINRRNERVPASESRTVDQLCEAFTRRCRAHGVRVTTQRLAVYRALAEDPSHPTADSIYQRLRGAMPALSPATVYRVLESLVCRVCGRMTDVHPATVPTSVVGRVAARARPRFVVEDVDIRIVGRCQTCPPAARPDSGRPRTHATRPRPGRP
jgi:Fe2+ or Zn2+ uptake regulation protein